MATVIKIATMSISKKQETALNQKLQEAIEAICVKAEKPVNKASKVKQSTHNFAMMKTTSVGCNMPKARANSKETDCSKLDPKSSGPLFRPPAFSVPIRA